MGQLVSQMLPCLLGQDMLVACTVAFYKFKMVSSIVSNADVPARCLTATCNHKSHSDEHQNHTLLKTFPYSYPGLQQAELHTTLQPNTVGRGHH